MKTIIRSAILTFALASSALAAPPQFLAPSNPPPVVNLAWTPVPDATVTNYFIYEGTNSGQYTIKLPAGTNSTLAVSNLLRGTTAFFNITAQNNFGLESAFGGEINYTPPAGPAAPTFKPIIILQVQNTPQLVPPIWRTIATISLAQNINGDGYFFRTKIASQ